MNSLIIDCSAGMSLILLKEDQEFVFIDDNAKRHSDELLVVLDKLLKKASLKINMLDNICVCIGPGSFTGVRVAISICKGLAIGLNAKVFAVSNLDVYDMENDTNSVLVLDGFSEFVYIKYFENGVAKNKCISINDLALFAKNNNYRVFCENEKVQKKLKNIKIQSQIVQKITKSIFLSKIKNNDFIDLNKIEPLYLRASQAEIERNKKLEGN